MRKIALAIVIMLTLPLTSCGFSPMYGKHGITNQTTVTNALDSIYITNIPDRKGQFLRNALIDRFYQNGRPAHPRYTLTIEPVNEKRTDLDITKSSDATRAQLRLKTSLKLTESDTGILHLQRDLTSITSYNILQSQFTTRVSEQDARENALNDLARQIERHLALYFQRMP